MFPVLYENGSFVIFTHDVFMTLGLLAGLAIYYWELKRRDMLGKEIFWISILALVGGSIGARLSVAWEHPAYYSTIGDVPFSYFLAHSGKSIIGGLVGGYVAVALSKRAFHYTTSTGDCYAAAIPVAMAIGRIGCFLSELPLGTPTDLPWGISVPPSAAANVVDCAYCAGKMHPSMLYEILFNLAALALIVRYRKRVRVRGDTLKMYLLASAVFRFLVEYVRGAPVAAFGLTGAQVALIPITALLVLYFVRNWRRGVYSMPAPPRPIGAIAASQTGVRAQTDELERVPVWAQN